MKKTAMLVLSLLLCMTALGAQALTVTGPETDIVDRLWEENAFFLRMEELTGVAVQAHGCTMEEYAGLLGQMQGGQAPADVLFKANLTRTQEIALADSGAIIDLAPHIQAHMPNLSALLEENPQWKEIISLDDGRIVSLPLLNERERQAAMWINKSWLDKLGVAMPTTIEELTAALVAIRDGDPNGNGKADERPLDLLGVYEMRWLLPYFGIVADDYHLARDAQGQIVFAPQMPEYRAFVEQLTAWNEAGLLRKDAFTAAHSTEVLNEEEEDAPVVSGMLFSITPYTHVSASAVVNYVPLLMAGPDGQVRWRDLLGEVWTGCFAVTSACADVGEALAWVDALYGEAGALLAYGGKENEDYVVGAEGWSFLLGGGRSINDILAESLIYTGTATPGLYPAAFIHSVDSAEDKHVFAGSEAVRAVSSQVTPAYALSAADQARADELALVLGEMVDCGIARFISGEVPLTDETYAAWLKELEAAGSGELAALYAGL